MTPSVERGDTNYTAGFLSGGKCVFLSKMLEKEKKNVPPPPPYRPVTFRTSSFCGSAQYANQPRGFQCPLNISRFSAVRLFTKPVVSARRHVGARGPWRYGASFWQACCSG